MYLLLKSHTKKKKKKISIIFNKKLTAIGPMVILSTQ